MRQFFRLERLSSTELQFWRTENSAIINLLRIIRGEKQLETLNFEGHEDRGVGWLGNRCFLR